MSLIAIIPARAGSKGIANKNMALLANKPLIQYTIEAARQAPSITRILVTSDSPEILQLAKDLGAEPIERPIELAQDSTPTQPVIVHCLRNAGVSSVDQVILLQPTSPLRTEVHIEQAVEHFRAQNADLLVGVTPAAHHPMKAYQLNADGFLEGAFGADYPYYPRQSLPDCYFANGAIYLFSAGEFLRNEDFPKTRIVPYVMSAQCSLDIDTKEDLQLAENQLTGER